MEFFFFCFVFFFIARSITCSFAEIIFSKPQYILKCLRTSNATRCFLRLFTKKLVVARTVLVQMPDFKSAEQGD